MTPEDAERNQGNPYADTCGSTDKILDRGALAMVIAGIVGVGLLVWAAL